MELHTGIQSDDRAQISQGLSKFLAETYTLYLKTQNFHWNVTGPNFHSLHEMFEEQYQNLADAADEIAERIRALGFPAPASFTAFKELSTVKEETGTPKAAEMLKQLLSDNETLMKTARTIFPLVEKAGDEATADLLTQRIHGHEKVAWMLRSTIA